MNANKLSNADSHLTVILVAVSSVLQNALQNIRALLSFASIRVYSRLFAVNSFVSHCLRRSRR